MLARIKRLIMKLQFWKMLRPRSKDVPDIYLSALRSGILTANELRAVQNYGVFFSEHKHRFVLIPDFGFPVFVYAWKCVTCPQTNTAYKHLVKKELINA